MPSHHTCSHSEGLRRYSVGEETRGVGSRTERVMATGRTAISGSRALIFCSEANGIVGTSSACTEEGVTIFEDTGGAGDTCAVSLDGETVTVLSFSFEVESLLCIYTHPSKIESEDHLFCNACCKASILCCNC